MDHHDDTQLYVILSDMQFSLIDTKRFHHETVNFVYNHNNAPAIPCLRWYLCEFYISRSHFMYKSVRKSKDYIYGIWVYKALDIWKGYYRVKKSLVSYVKPWTEARNNKYMKYHSKLTYQLSFWNVSRKVDYHAGGKCYFLSQCDVFDSNSFPHTITYLVSWITFDVITVNIF